MRREHQMKGKNEHWRKQHQKQERNSREKEGLEERARSLV